MVVLAAVKIGEILRWVCSFTGDRREACGGLEAGPQALPAGCAGSGTQKPLLRGQLPSTALWAARGTSTC